MPYTIKQAQAEYDASGVVTLVDGDAMAVVVYEDDSEASEQYRNSDEFGYFIVSFDFEGRSYFCGKVVQ